MSSSKTTATSAELVRQFARYSDVALSEPVVVTKNGRARHVLLSVTEYERLKRRDQLAFSAADTPDRFLGDIESLAK
ncbi:MAG: type II toxin-antitoxin system prevent-host-death family antitoxin [Devosia sp.]